MSIIKFKYVICNKKRDQFLAIEKENFPIITDDICIAKHYEKRDNAVDGFKDFQIFCRKAGLIYIRLLQIVYVVTFTGILDS